MPLAVTLLWRPRRFQSDFPFRVMLMPTHIAAESRKRSSITRLELREAFLGQHSQRAQLECISNVTVIRTS